MILAALSQPGPTPMRFGPNKNLQSRFRVSAEAFPSFIPREVEQIKDPFARNLASRIERLPVQVSFLEGSIMSSCVKPMLQTNTSPVILLHGFDSSCLEWRYALPLLEEAGLETWAMDILGFRILHELERLPSCDVASKRDHLYQFWKSYIRRPMLLVGPSLGAAVAIDFAVNHPEAVYLLKSIPLRLYATFLAFNGLPLDTCLDWTNVGRLHCLLPWWEDATVAFMDTGGYNVSSVVEQVKQKTLIIWGEEDQIISNKLGVKLHCELPNSIIRQVPDCGHIPHVENPSFVAKLIMEFSREHCSLEAHLATRN
ncbi:alpha/beta hydrolase domain-containing protein VTE7 isoform X4 [Actinidia eriantha]|uniref:alpha/beta hydrolase domain-containing protein VTE7 isoform X4 n=1 Tax=Actinidia eriantha TaxID=165200 RepID=UPI002585ECD8|nr:alpha/beta hydrolase domain-containing protein VTE7 isoform X4 [Actinidia eriantha]